MLYMWFIYHQKLARATDNVRSSFYVSIFIALKVVLSEETSLELDQTFHVDYMLHRDSWRLNIVNFKAKLRRLVW